MQKPTWARNYERLRSQAAVTPQKRGYQFETVLWDMLSHEALWPRRGYRPRGEQIDGSFVLDGRVFLLEAKWVAQDVPASTLYEFRGKVDGKLVGTIGVFVSISGYSSDAVDALIAGKTLNLILFDGYDMDVIARGELSFADALRQKLRAAAEQGTPYNPLTGGLRTTRAVATRRAVVVEGQSDIYLLSLFLRESKGEFDDIQFLGAFGRLNVPRVADAYASEIGGLVRDTIVVVDADGKSSEGVVSEILRGTPNTSLDASSIFVLAPTLEAAFGVERGWWRDYLTTSDRAKFDARNLWDGVRDNPTLQQLAERLGATPPDL